jgi:streptogramin lyase
MLNWIRRALVGDRLVRRTTRPQFRPRLEPLEDRAAPSVTTEFPTTAGSNPLEMVLGPDGNLWFTEFGGDRIGRITPTGAIHEFPLNAGSGPSGITVGPDGNIWFTEQLGDRIGRLSPLAGSNAAIQASIHEYALIVNSKPFGIVAGPDGNLWFTENGNSSIGRITTAGVVNTFGIAGSPGPLGIAVGPDKQLWFTESIGDAIGRINALAGSNAAIQASIIQFPLPIPLSGGGAITAGPDGALWFTEFLLDKIGRINTAGVVTDEFLLPIKSGPTGIIAGPDGRLYFADNLRHRIGRLTTAGAYAEMASDMTPGAFPADVAFGADGALWFTEIGGGRIGRTPLTIGAVTAAARGGLVRVFDAKGAPQQLFAPFGKGFAGSLALAVGDVNADGVPDILVGPATGGPPVVVAFNTANGALVNFVMLPPAIFKGGVALAAGDVNADGFADFIVGAPKNGQPLIAEFSGKSGVLLNVQLLPPALFKGRLALAAGDVNGDGFADIIAGVAKGGPPIVEVFSGKTGALLNAFLAMPPNFKGGLSLAAGDVSGDGVADIVAGVASGGPPLVISFDGKTGTPLNVFQPAFGGGVVVAVEHADPDKFADVLAAPATGQPPLVATFANGTGQLLSFFFAFPLGAPGGFALAAGDHEDALPLP